MQKIPGSAIHGDFTGNSDPMRLIKHRWKCPMREKKQALKPSASLWLPAKRSQLHIMAPHCWTCLPNTAWHREVPLRNHWEVRRAEPDITLRAVIGKSALRVIRGVPRLVMWCCSSYYGALEEKLTRTLNHIIWGCLFWYPPLLLCEWQLESSESWRWMQTVALGNVTIQCRLDDCTWRTDTDGDTQHITHTRAHTHLKQNLFLGIWDGTVNAS